MCEGSPPRQRAHCLKSGVRTVKACESRMTIIDVVANLAGSAIRGCPQAPLDTSFLPRYNFTHEQHPLRRCTVTLCRGIMLSNETCPTLLTCLSLHVQLPVQFHFSQWTLNLVQAQRVAACPKARRRREWPAPAGPVTLPFRPRCNISPWPVCHSHGFPVCRSRAGDAAAPEHWQSAG